MQRERYDSTGRVEKSVEEEFSDSFAGGKHSVVPGYQHVRAPAVRSSLTVCTGFCDARVTACMASLC